MKTGADILKTCKRYFMEMGEHNTETVLDLHDAEEAIDNHIKSLEVSKKEEYENAKKIIKEYDKIEALKRWKFNITINDSVVKGFWYVAQLHEKFEVKHCTSRGELNSVEGFGIFEVEDIYIVTDGEYKDCAIHKKHTTIFTTIPKENWGVHQSHCCEEHFCKYGDDDCPVVLGIIKQGYPCEMCNDPTD